MKIILRFFGVLGALLFGTVLYFTYEIPGYVEDIGKEFIRGQIQKESDEQIDKIHLAVKDGVLAQIAGKLQQANQDEIDRLKEELRNGTHEKLAAIIAEMRNLDCECRKKYSDWFKEGLELKIASLESANASLQDFLKAKYMQVAHELTRDVRIFAGSNMAIFLLMVSVSFLKPRAMAHLVLPGMLLFISTVVCAYFYVFEQNWLMTMIYSDYVGYGYLGYVGVMFAFLCDIVFNKARVTTEIINGALQAIGSTTTVAPC